jgi:hypothetical protein
LPQRATELEGDGVAGGQRHDTVPGQAASSAALAASTTSSPPSNWFGGAAFSVPRPSSSTDASHP